MEKNYFSCMHNLQDVMLRGIDIYTKDGKLFLLNVYLPYQSPDDKVELCNYLGKIASIIEEKDTSNIVSTGDFNATLNTPFEAELIDMCDTIGMVISDYDKFGRTCNTYTYVSDPHYFTSWLDHFICSQCVHPMITDSHISDKGPSDHLPVGLVIAISVTAESHDNVSNEKHADKMPPIFRWSKAQYYKISEYGKSSAVHLDKVHIPESFTRTKTNCSNRWHTCNIDNLFDDICKALWVTSLETISTCKNIVSRFVNQCGKLDYFSNICLNSANEEKTARAVAIP